ncbi:hypothetical protein CMUS01_11672 [Colletotrichum musicola]|uniref:Tc1-like transposase DDE domain-containing protein n=1 Tax=Colletotrichum musicola TaxID=2175873 RepID=A0A8H6N480_9PEZI|nr:hypothetical protein CMUS01_11672 [Colletotrichum musicola]
MERRPRDIHTKHLTEADRQRVRILYYDAGLGPTAIARQTGFSVGQVKHAIRAESAAVRPRSGRPRELSAQQEAELVEYVTSSRQGRQATFLQLSCLLFNSLFGVYAIRSALRRLGFMRRVARRKPPISESNRQRRLAWVTKRQKWTSEQWKAVLWTDETWITGGCHRKQYISRRRGEEWDPTCIIEKHQRRRGWMFWGCFSGGQKGPGILWEKEWGTITADTYQQRIVPLIDGWIRLCSMETGGRLLLMQDGAPSHSATATLQDLNERGVTVLDWPPYSPDLNPIEMCWNWMKDFVEDKYGLTEKPTYDQLRQWVYEAWEALPVDFLDELLASMPARCQAVIDAEGMHTRY